MPQRTAFTSTMNGRGPHAWDHHWLVVPLYDQAGQIFGRIWADDPADRLLPSPSRLQALRVFANQAMMAVIAAGHVEQLRAQADRDSLTGMLNRRAFMRELSTEIERSLRYGRRFVLALCDLDGFKRINDTDGHPAGDRALEGVAALLEGSLRASDFAFRIGGDEFALLLPETDADEAQEVVERIVNALAGDSVLAGGLGISFGLASSRPTEDARGAHPPRRPGALRGQALRRRPALRAARGLSGHTLGGVADPGHVALGTWSGGRFMRFGEAIEEERLAALLRPGDGIDTVITADTYGSGEADAVLGRALRGVERESTAWSAPWATTSTKASARGRGASRASPTRACAGRAVRVVPAHGGGALARALGVDRFDLLLLHNPDRIGFEPGGVEGMAALRDAGLTRTLGVAPGPANGFTLDLIDCLERFGELIDWAMVILNPLEPWPGELVLPAARATASTSSRAWSTTAGSSGTTCGPGTASPSTTIAPSGPRAGCRPGASAWSACARSPSATG